MTNQINEIREELGYLTESGLRWLWIDMANTFGYDKSTFDIRVKLAKDEYKAYLDNKDHMFYAESPWEFRNACEAMIEHDKKAHVEHMVYLDCTNQALQLYALATSCKDTGYLCNLSSGDVLTDAYGLIAIEMNNKLGVELFDRNSCKKALMTTLYGKSDGEMEIVKYMEENKIDYLRHISIEDLTPLFQNAMKKVAPTAMRAMDALQMLNSTVLDTYYWKLPDGFVVKYDVKSSMELEISARTKGGVTFSFDKEVEIYKANRFSRGMAPNVIHSFDGYIARELVRRMTMINPKYNRTYPCKVTTIHDAYATHPNNIEEMQEHYADILCELNDSNILQNVMTQINGAKMLSLKVNTLTNEMIRESIYKLS